MSRLHVERILSIALTLLMLHQAAPASAQAPPLVLEVQGGASIPLGPFRSGTRPGEGTSAGPSFGVDFALSSAGRRVTYVGFSQHRFGCAAAGCASGERYVATGVDLGTGVSLLRRGPVIPWIRLGAMTTRVEMPATTTTQAGVSALGFGGEVGLGLFLRTSRAVSLSPSVRYTAVNSGLPGGGVLRMRYLVADLSLVLGF